MRSISTKSLLVCLASVAVAVCSTGCVTSGTAAGLHAEQFSPGGDLPGYSRASDVIGGQELRATGVASTSDALHRLRPEFLRTTRVITGVPDADPMTAPSVYVNGKYAGELNALELIPLAVIEEIRFLRPSQAKDSWGAYCRCGGGVIHIRTKQG
jgi:hypothetical protein